MNEKITPIAKRAVVIALCINLLAGAQYCWSMLGSSLMKEFGWTATQASLPYSVMMVVTSLWAIIVGNITDRIGPQFTIRIGSVSICLSLIIAGHTSNWWIMMFAIGILMGIASTSFTSNTASTAVKFMPLKYKGFASGIVSAGMGWTSFYMAPLINKLLEVTSIANTFTILGIICGTLTFILSFLLPNPIKYPELTVTDSGNVSEVDHSKYKNTVSGKAIFTKKETWILFSLFACAGMAGQMLTSQMNNIAMIHAGLKSGYVLIMAMGLANGLGRICISSLSDRIGVCNTWRLIYIATAVDMLLLAIANNFTMMLVGVIVLGIFYGGSVPLVWAADTAVFGKKYVTSVQGVVTNGFAIAALVGPTLASRIVESTGGYTTAFYTIIIFTVIGFILSFAIKDNYDS
jgi:OFA family oxalate/formate antiporter-like MFS transporter